MRSALAALVAAATVAAGAVGIGCVIVTGSTDGYRAKGSGDGGGGDGASVSLACVSSADCGDAGDVCCVVVSSSLTSMNTACQAAPCTGILPAQLCKTTAECGKTGLCTTQSCTLGSSTVTIQACGTVSACTAQ
ncbi:MAG TPA: hypothetical protein VMI75_09365 [Polyangiaceae bacterium]|nr:hypothetical protein [Polyangiaceae bacterium]